MTEPALHQIHAIIHGRVQGVNFRASATAEARRLRLAGWVRNRDDGTVETLAQGARGPLETYLAWLRHGPTYARVDQVQVEWQPVSALLDGFEVRYE